MADHEEIICSFCDLPSQLCRVLLANAVKTSYICEACAPAAARQCRDIIGAEPAEQPPEPVGDEVAGLTADQLAAFKEAFYRNSGDETDDPFVLAFKAAGVRLAPAVPPTGIAREAYGVKIDFVADCLRMYSSALSGGVLDGAGHYFPADIEEAANMLEDGELELLQTARALVSALVQTPEHADAMERLRTIVGSRS